MVLKHKLLVCLLFVGFTASATAPVAALSAVPVTLGAADCKPPLVSIEGSGDQSVCCPKGTKAGDATGCVFGKYINPAVELLSALVGIAVVASIIIGAIQYSSAGGDPGKVEKAKGRIQNAILALIAYVFLFALLQWLIPGGIL